MKEYLNPQAKEKSGDLTYSPFLGIIEWMRWIKGIIPQEEVKL
ncbi:MAG: hypothetical protein ABIM44_07960 [candidate division WOR-3 bacterium]